MHKPVYLQLYDAQAQFNYRSRNCLIFEFGFGISGISSTPSPIANIIYLTIFPFFDNCFFFAFQKGASTNMVGRLTRTDF